MEVLLLIQIDRDGWGFEDIWRKILKGFKYRFRERISSDRDLNECLIKKV